MIRSIMRDPMFLSRKSHPAVKEDLPVLDDLLDTLRAHQDSCVGMAANMIGVSKRIIAIMNGPFPMGMINPVILQKKDPYSAEEGCLSLDGVRKTIRYQTIVIAFEDRQMNRQQMTFSGWTAQIIQHEMDHLDGILI